MNARFLILTILASVNLLRGEDNLELAVNALADVKDVGFGYSALFSGTTFLPRNDVAAVSTTVLGVKGPQPSDAMTTLVKAGPKAFPVLLKHMDDKRPTKLEPVSGMMWMGWDDEFDYNRRTDPRPKNVNRDSFGEAGQPDAHQMTVGDLCFVALGQIVNRSFCATRYQPSGGMIVSSPTYSPRLLEAVRTQYGTMSPEAHRRTLLSDFEKPDHEGRRTGALVRLSFYYPELIGPLVVKQLKTPTFDVFKVSSFVRDVLYPTKDSKTRKARFEQFVGSEGEASRDGIRQELFRDLDTQIADEEGRLHPPMKKSKRYDARDSLIQLYGYPRSVLPKDAPFCDSWEESAKARFIELLGPIQDKEVREEVTRVFRSISDDDYLALACMKALMGKGLDKELLAYCEHRAPLSKHEKDELKQMAKILKN